MIDLSYLKDDLLARLFFRRLWQKYSDGGVNCGRSLRSALVERYFDFVQCEPPKNIQELDIEYYYKEALNRPPCCSLQVFLFSDIKSFWVLDSEEIAMLCLVGLQEWYEVEALKLDGDWCHHQKIMINTVCRLLPLPIPQKKFSLEEWRDFALYAGSRMSHMRIHDLLRTNPEFLT